MRPFPKIETERLFLTELKAADVPLIVKYAGNEKIARYTSNIPHPYAEKDAIYWINMTNQGFRDGSQLTFGIRLKPDNVFIGGMGLSITTIYNRAEIGYWLAEQHWNRGYTSEAANALIDYGFNEIGLNKITSSYMDINPASGKVMENCGMFKEGEQKDQILKNGNYHDLILYGLTKEQFDQR